MQFPTPQKATRPLNPFQPKRVLVVDQTQTFRAGLVQAMGQTSDLQVVAESASGAEFLEGGQLPDIDVAVVDIYLPDGGSAKLARLLTNQFPDLVLLVLASSDWDAYLVAARVMQAAGLLNRALPTPDLLQAIRQATTRPIYTPEQLERVERWSQGIGTRLRTLRPREWHVLWALSQGLTNREVSELLAIAEHTVEKHVGSILQKLEVRSRGQLLALIMVHHLDVFSRLFPESDPA